MLQRQQVGVAAVVLQRVVDELDGGVRLTGRSEFAGLPKRGGLAPLDSQVRQQRGRALATGIKRLRATQQLLGEVEVACRFGRTDLLDQLGQRLGAREQEPPAQLRAVRVLRDAGFQRLHRVLIVPLSDQLFSVAANAVDRAARNRDQACKRKRCRHSAQVHQRLQTNSLPRHCIFRRYFWLIGACSGIESVDRCSVAACTSTIALSPMDSTDQPSSSLVPISIATGVPVSPRAT